MSKIAVAITDGDPDDPTVTAIILLDESDYPLYEEAARQCYKDSVEAFPELLDEVLGEMNKRGIKFEVIMDADVKDEWGYFHFVD